MKLKTFDDIPIDSSSCDGSYIPPDYMYYPEDYAYDSDPFTEDEYEISKIKYVLEHCLTMTERHIFLLYVHNDSSYTKLSKLISCSPAMARNYILRLRNKIKDNL